MSTRKQTESTFVTFDGEELFCRTWEPEAPTEKALIVLHRGHEHSGRLTDLVEALDLGDFRAFAYDMRGHGRSPGERGYAESYDVWVRDLDAFVRHVSKTHGIAYENMSVVANSVGAVTACTWVHDYAPRIRSMVLRRSAFPQPIGHRALLLRQTHRSQLSSGILQCHQNPEITHRHAREGNDSSPHRNEECDANCRVDERGGASRSVTERCRSVAKAA